ncbi:O-antigen ligase family protein [Chthonomonas calidirosea]|uniref:O-antigen ligase family protein n=1 Tax=Chthonomonas calidirosea TaxID=454171 RepID=UPI0006EC9990|nr:O-antigen ligase family protein [Chthonomonas calidirosea]CEK12664.1 lipid A core-O-antigen ligase-like enyme [Chthonomonas calidirosea]
MEADIKETRATERKRFDRLDWMVVVLLGLMVVLAPLLAASFVVLPAMGLFPPIGLLDWLQAIGVPLMMLLVGLAALIAVVREWIRPMPIGGAPALTVLGLCVLGWATLSLGQAHALYLGVDTLALLVAVLTTGTLASRLSRNKDAFATLLIALMLGGLFVSALGINEYLAAWKQGAFSHRVFGTFLNPDFLAGYLLLTLPVTLAIWVASRERLLKLSAGFALFLQGGCITLSASRAGLAALCIGILAWLFLCVWSGAFRGRWRSPALGLGVLLLSFVVASTPLRFRATPVSAAQASASRPVQSSAENDAGASGLARVGAESHSLLFRRYTWHGTLRMAEANPLFGVGIGNFTYAYPRYALVAFTAHAHNSLLQWASETGFVGLCLLLMLLAAASAFAANALRLRRAALSAPAGDILESFHRLFEEPAVLLCGLLAALLASGIKTLVDSDWYVVATALTVGLCFGLAVGLARDIAPLSTQLPTAVRRSSLMLAGLVALGLVLRSGQLGFAAGWRAQAAEALFHQQPEVAIERLKAATKADPLDPELYLELGEIYDMEGLFPQEQAAIQRAIRVAPIAKAYYRLGQFYEKQGQGAQAVAVYQHAYALDPNNLQVLHHLGDAFLAVGKTQDAENIYRIMTELEHAPYGTVRAMGDELVETEFVYGQVGLAEIEMRQGQSAEALKHLEDADALMRLYWSRRNTQAYAIMPASKREALYQLYLRVLADWRQALRQTHAGASALAAVAQEESRVQQDHRNDQVAPTSPPSS